MMDKKGIEGLLSTFSQQGVEPVRPGLMQEIKDRIPRRLVPHRLDTINIIVDLRISRLAATAAIIVAVLAAGIFFGRGAAGGDGIYRDSKLFLKYALGGEKAYRSDVAGTLAGFRDNLIAQGREVVYYGENPERVDPHAILMHWKLSDDKYGVILGDLSARTVSAKTLIRLQSYMLGREGSK